MEIRDAYGEEGGAGDALDSGTNPFKLVACREGPLAAIGHEGRA